MFGFKRNEKSETSDELKRQIKELTKDKKKLIEGVERLKLQKKIEEEDIKHMVRLKEERMVVDFEKKTLELERAKASEIAEIKDRYRDKVEINLEKQKDDVKGMYAGILERLPNVNVRLKGDA